MYHSSYTLERIYRRGDTMVITAEHSATQPRVVIAEFPASDLDNDGCVHLYRPFLRGKTKERQIYRVWRRGGRMFLFHSYQHEGNVVCGSVQYFEPELRPDGESSEHGVMYQSTGMSELLHYFVEGGEVALPTKRYN